MTLADAATRQAALTDFQNNLVVVAGAGSGKTSLLVGRLASALVRLHLEPHQVLALTFTDLAAAEMRQRLVRLLRAVGPWLDGEPIPDASDLHTIEMLGFRPEDRRRVEEVLAAADRLAVQTFHSFCAGLLRRFARQLGLPPDQRPPDEEASRTAYRRAFLQFLQQQTDLHPALERFEPSALRDLGEALLSLPEEAVNRAKSKPMTADLDAARVEVHALRAEWPKAAAKFREMLDDLETAIDAIEADRPIPSSVELPKDTRRPGAGVPKDVREAVVERAAAVLEAVRPYAVADDTSVRLAIEFLEPFLATYREDVQRRGEMSFDDVILRTRHALMHDEHLRERAGGNLRAILVDEFQDTDPLLYDIVFMLACEPKSGAIAAPLELPLRPSTLFIVGDPKQSIYRFRNADIAAFDLAARRVEATGGVRCDLVCNFRSEPGILDFVNHIGAQLIAEDRPYQLGYTEVVSPREGEDTDGPVVRILHPEGLDDSAKAPERRLAEGRLAVQLIHEAHAAGESYGEIAVLLSAATDINWLLRPLREAGIPYAVEGSRRFYKRHEVVVATGLLAAIARPHDPVAVTSVLRSALSAATDRELFEFLQAHREADASGNPLDYRCLHEEAEGAIATTLRWLRDLHDEAHSLPLDVALERILGLDAWTIAEGSGFEGAQRIANIERLLHRLRAAAPLDLGAAAEFLEQRTLRETDDEESPLFDRDRDAVRVMTVHKSKGLEFGTVIVPDLARTQRRQSSRDRAEVERTLLGDGTELVGIKVDGITNVAYELNRHEVTKHAAAESRRLLYVAATRAERQLILLTAPAAKSPSWQTDLEACAPLPSHVDENAVAAHTTRPPDVADDARSRVAETLHAHARHRERITATDSPPADQASDLAAPQLGSRTDADATSAAPGADAAAATLGTAVHRYLATADLGADWNADLCAAFGEPSIEADLANLTRDFHGGPLCARIRAADRVLRECPVTYRDATGHIAHGIVDMMLLENDRWSVIDHKTDIVPDGDHRAAAERHRAQLDRYAEGIRQAMELTTAPERVLFFVRDGVAVTLDAE